jgi:ferredoxin-type protein NapH
MKYLQGLAMSKYKTNALIDKTPFFSAFISTDKNGKKRPSIRFYRWLSVFSVNALFFLSYKLDFQILEGTLSGSRMLGFHLIDPFASLQILLAFGSLHTNLIIGALSIVLFYFFVGGRAFCSWVCPYGVLSEIAEKLNKELVKKGVVKPREFNHKIKYLFWALFLFLAFWAGFLVYETINPVGILSRAITYGFSFALFVILALFLAELFFARRCWCRYVCPIGTTYGFLGWIGLTKIKRSDKCNNCGACSKVCVTPHILNDMKGKRAKKGDISVLSKDCTLCGRCVEVCSKDALSFETILKKLI